MIHMSKSIGSRNWKLRRIIQARVEELALAMHLQVCDEGIPVRH